jgi:hypothetical protein
VLEVQEKGPWEKERPGNGGDKCQSKSEKICLLTEEYCEDHPALK